VSDSSIIEDPKVLVDLLEKNIRACYELGREKEAKKSN